MDLQAIRNKYKLILQDDSLKKTNNNFVKEDVMNYEEQSQRQWIKIVNKQRNRRVLTQNRDINSENIEKGSRKNSLKGQHKKGTIKISIQDQIIGLKQKLAQSLLNITRKDKQIDEFENLLMRKNQEIKQLRRSIEESKKTILQKQSKLTSQKLKLEESQKVIKTKETIIQEIKIQNQLLKKHLSHHALEIQTLSIKLNDSYQNFQSLESQIQKTQQFKYKIQKIKDDNKRLQFLLADHEVYAPLVGSLQGKHFLGKPQKYSKQLQYWYPEALINGIEQFLKRQQIGFGNRGFTQNIAKFIYGLLERKQKNCQKNYKNKFSSRMKQLKRKKNQILNLFQNKSEQEMKKKSEKSERSNSRLGTSSLRKTTPLNGNSMLRSKDFSVCLQKSLCLQKKLKESQFYGLKEYCDKSNSKSFIIEGLQKSLQQNENRKKETIMELIEQFRQGMARLQELINKALWRQKVGELIDWLKESVLQVLCKSGKKGEGKCLWNETGKWKTMGEMDEF